MSSSFRKYALLLPVLLWLLFFLTSTILALDTGVNNVAVASAGQPVAADTEEVLLTFRYRGVGNVYVMGLFDYSTDKMYLPVTEIFNLLQIYYEPSPGDFSLAGNFITPGNPFRILFSQQQVILGSESFGFEPDEFRIGELDFYLSPLVFEEVFDLYFAVNLNTLVLSLETDQVLPVEERSDRESARQLIEAREVTREYYPLEYDRQRQFVGLGFVDYNINGDFYGSALSTSYTFTGGAEFLGGDIHGNISGFYAGDKNSLRSGNLRWRYVVRDNPWFSSLSAGQLSTTGLLPRSIIGVSVSNDPVEPRRIYETFIIDGNTEPDSEVELYLNNRLIDFVRSDQLGYYRFEFPLTYGTSRLTMNIYTPSGLVETIERQVQIPFTYLPRGQVAYHLQGGVADSYPGDMYGDQKLLHGDIAVGVTNWLTAKLGSDYIQGVSGESLLTYGSLSARLFSQYLVNFDVAPNAYYRGIVSVMYPRGRSFSLQYTHYDGYSNLNTGNLDYDMQVSFFTPFNLFSIPMGIRIGGDYRAFGENSLSRYRTDLSMRLGRFNLRMNYREVLYNTGGEYSLGQGQIDGSLTYTFMRSPGIPVFIRGMFLRGSVAYNTTGNMLEKSDIQVTKSIRRDSRVNLNAGYDYRLGQLYTRLGFIMDLASVRSTTNVDLSGGRSMVRQNFRGSVGLDQNPGRVLPNNRNQVGRAGASVILFVDNNNSGKYDEGDDIIPHRAIRLDRSAQISVSPDGVIHISQLQSYFRYNMDVVRSALPNPMLAPGIDNFSFVADPNRFKRIEIPFYRTGVIDGAVLVERDGKRSAQGGMRMILTGVDVDFNETIRNFSDGSFYAMDMLPGNYRIEIDPVQLSFLNVKSEPSVIEFEVRALAEGDFIENLNFLLVPD